VRNHYVADVLGGMVTGTLGYFLGRRLMKRSSAIGSEAGAPSSKI